jgi:putative hemolysin
MPSEYPALWSFFLQEWLSFVVILVCIGFSAFFSASETAITSLGTMKIKHLLESHTKKWESFRLWIDHPGRVIVTILLFNNGVNILASSLMTEVTYLYVGNGAVGLATGITTFLVLIFGEIIPKSFGKAHADALGLPAMKGVRFFYYLGYPLIRPLAFMADKAVTSLSGRDQAYTNPSITEEELEFMVSEGERAGVIEDLKIDIIEGAFNFDDTTVREIMTPRTNLTAVESKTPLKELVHLVIKTGHSRIPVYREHIDHVVGVILAKDLLSHDLDGNLTAHDLARECLFAPESQSIMAVFKDLKRSKNHMAVIIDEYGGTSGIVTMEDVLEEIVGDIQDEFDKEQAKVIKIEEGVYQVSGSLHIEEFFEHFGIEEAEHPVPEIQDLDSDTLAGWITQLVGQIPEEGQEVAFGHLKMLVLKVSKRRVELVQVLIQRTPPGESP